MKKICLCLLLSAILICQCLFKAPFVNASDNLTPEAELLSAIGLLKGDGNGDFRLNDTITRAEYTALILRMMGYELLSNQMGDSTPFTDVPKEHWSSGYVRLASELKLVNGTGNNLFEPDREISYKEAVKIMVCALGYGVLAEKDGGYFDGYSRWALRLNLLKGIKSSGTFTRENACSLIENALTVDILDAMGEVVSGENVLTKYLGFTAMEGIVTGTEGISETKINKGYIEISGKKYKTRYSSPEELFACEVEFYVYERNSAEEEICYIKVKENENRLDISYKEILDTTTLNEFKHLENKRVQTRKLSDSLIIYYNGEKVSSKYMDKSLLTPDLGNVVLCDADLDNVYDLAIVSSYRTMVVNYYGHETIYDIYGKHLAVDTDKTEVFAGNEQIEIENLEKGNVICVAQSISGEKTRIYKTDEILSGYLFEKGINDYGDDFYSIKQEDGTARELVISKSYRDALDAKKATDILSFGKQKINVALNFFGEISDAWYDETDEPLALRYGFLIGAGRTGTINGGLQIKVLTANNRFEIFEVPSGERITFGRMENGTYRTAKETTNTVYIALGKEDTQRQLIRYRLDENNKLTQLYLADEQKNPGNFSEDVPRFFATYRQSVLDQKYYISSDTVVFSMPRDSIYENVMAAGKPQNFFSDGQSRFCTLYDVDNGVVGAVVIDGAPAVRYDSNEEGYEKTLSYSSSPVMFITKSLFSRADDGEFYMNVEGYEDGKQVSVMVADNLSQSDEEISKLTPGTVIQYETNSYIKLNAKDADKPEQMVMVEKIFNFNNNETSGILWNHDIIVEKNPEIITIWGVLKEADPAFLTIEVENEGETDAYVMAILNNSTFMKYDSDKKEFSLISAKEIVPGQRVYLCKRGNKQDIVVY